MREDKLEASTSAKVGEDEKEVSNVKGKNMVEEPEIEAFKVESKYEGDYVIALLEVELDLIAMMGLIPLEFMVDSEQPDQFERDVFEEEAEWAVLVNPAVNQHIETMKFEKPKGTLARHLKPLYIQVHINGRTVSRVFVDGGAILNMMPIHTSKGLGGYYSQFKENQHANEKFYR